MKLKGAAPLPSDLIAVGQVTRTVGIRGEVNLLSLTDDPRRFKELKEVWVGPDETAVERFTIAGSRQNRSGVVLKLKELETQSAAESRRGQLVYVRKSKGRKPASGSYFIHDIIGLQVVTEAGDIVGNVQDVLQLPANDVWVVMNDGKEMLIPALKQVIMAVDLKQRRVVINPLEGMLE
ncbi:MAG: 16S rRNA processing protein RimM [Ignavibacteriales bacterium]|nr:16S rRNA processing protein RimM [Ignavibacteriales bacterium]